MTRILVAVASMIVLAGSAAAQGRATVVKKSGEALFGTIAAIGDRDIVVDTDDGQRHRFLRAEVSVIDFVDDGRHPPAKDLRAGQQFVVLRSGEAFPARLDETTRDKDRNLQLILLTDRGRRVVQESDIERLYFETVPESATATTGLGPAIPPPPGSIAVPGNQQWTPTPITVRSGELVNFTSVGEVQLSTDNSDIAGPAGARNGRYAIGSPLPQALAGALIYRIGNSPVYPLGDQPQIRMSASGQLFFGINDDFVGDNQGQFYVTISKLPGRY